MKNNINYYIICNKQKKKKMHSGKTNGNERIVKKKKTANTQESTVFKSNIFSFCGNNGNKHKCIMKVTKMKTQKKIRKKYNKKSQK